MQITEYTVATDRRIYEDIKNAIAEKSIENIPGGGKTKRDGRINQIHSGIGF